MKTNPTGARTWRSASPAPAPKRAAHSGSALRSPLRLIRGLAAGGLAAGRSVGPGAIPRGRRLQPGGEQQCVFAGGAGGREDSGGGWFTTLGGQPRNCLGRLNNTEPATQTLSCDGSTFTWLRGGTSPEVWRTTFQWSSDDPAWTPLGAGSRIPGGWQRTEAVVPMQATIRARGVATGGQYKASGWFVKSLLTNLPPVVPAVVLWVEAVAGPRLRFKLTGETNAPYAVQTATNLAAPAQWQPAAALTLTNGWGTFDWTDTGEPARFFRAVRE